MAHSTILSYYRLRLTCGHIAGVRPDVPQRRRIVIVVRVEKRAARHAGVCRRTASCRCATAIAGCAGRAAGATRVAIGAAVGTAAAAAAAVRLRRTVERQSESRLQLLAARLAARARAVHIGDAAVGRAGRQRACVVAIGSEMVTGLI